MLGLTKLIVGYHGGCRGGCCLAGGEGMAKRKVLSSQEPEYLRVDSKHDLSYHYRSKSNGLVVVVSKTAPADVARACERKAKRDLNSTSWSG